MGALLTAAVFILCIALTSWRVGVGVGFTILAGTMYGITRANYFGLPIYFFFDLAVVGCYIGVLMNAEFRNRPVEKNVMAWMKPMIIWPMVLLPLEGNFLVSLVGLRTAILFLPFIIIGAKLNGSELIAIARFVAISTLVATGFAVAELALGVDVFYPVNDATDIIYLSNDIVVEGRRFLRVPGTFAHAASYASAMVMFVPLIVHGIEKDNRFFKLIFAAALLSCVMGVFISTTRSAVLILGAVLMYVLIRRPTILFNRYVAFTVLAVGITTYNIVADNPRFQRFKTLGEEDVVTDRFRVSNEDLSLIDMAIEYPIGGGLAYTGVSIPKFIKRTTPGINTENEYARVVGTQGVIGFILLFGFMIKGILAGFKRHHTLSSITSDATTGILLMTLINGFIGVGAFVGVPSACVLLLMLGFLLSRPPQPAS